jgi:hypothetical protein
VKEFKDKIRNVFQKETFFEKIENFLKMGKSFWVISLKDHTNKKPKRAGCQWLTPVVLAIWGE